MLSTTKKKYLMMILVIILVIILCSIFFFAKTSSAENFVKREIFFNERNKNTVLVKISIITNETIEVYDEIPKDCTPGEHGTSLILKNKIYAKVSNDSEINYELLCNYGNKTIIGYYFVNENYNEKFYIENTSFFINKVIPKELPLYFWFLILGLLIIFFIEVLKREEL
ncbi:MAG: hypothetical protein QXU20_01585 [Candidatus Woesearchaeota archaeon]